MDIPERVNNRWAATLDDPALVKAEAQLHEDFRQKDVAEKTKMGTRYRLLQGPTTLVDAWLRWQTVSNEARKRGLATNHHA